MGPTSTARTIESGSSLKAVADVGATVLGVHHTRKGESEDFLELASGSNGLMGAADFVMVLTRERTESDGLLRITGRDVVEAGYNLLFEDGIWTPNGTGLSDAAAQVQGPRLGEKMESILVLVNSRGITIPAKHPTYSTSTPILLASTFAAWLTTD